MKKPNFYITEENFHELIGNGGWRIQDLPNDRAAQVRDFLNNDDTLAVFASGEPPTQVDADHRAIGGIDWVRIESKPVPGETSLNVYHYVIMRPDETGYPVHACRNGTSIAPHWSEWEDLDVYFPDHENEDR